MTKRVLYILPTNPAPGRSYVAGVERYARNAAATLRLIDKGFEPCIAVFHDGEYAEDEQDGIRLIFLPDESSVKGPHSATGPELWRALGDVDLVHVVQPAHLCGAVALVVARSLDKPTVATYFGDGGLLFMLLNNNLDLADCVLFPSAALATLIPGLHDGRATILAAPIDDDVFALASPQSHPRKGVVCADPVRPESGLEKLVAAAPADLDLLLCGPQCDAQTLARLRTMAGPSVRIEATDSDAGLARVFRSAAVAITGLGGIAESPIALWPTEAMATGTALMVRAGDPATHFLPGPQAGRTFQDEEELKRQLAEIALGQWPETNSAAVAVAHAAAFGQRVVGKQLADLYRDLLARRGR